MFEVLFARPTRSYARTEVPQAEQPPISPNCSTRASDGRGSLAEPPSVPRATLRGQLACAACFLQRDSAGGRGDWLGLFQSASVMRAFSLPCLTI